MGRSCILDSHPDRWMPAEVRMPAVVRMPACHSRRFKDEANRRCHKLTEPHPPCCSCTPEMHVLPGPKTSGWPSFPFPPAACEAKGVGVGYNKSIAIAVAWTKEGKGGVLCPLCAVCPPPPPGTAPVCCLHIKSRTRHGIPNPSAPGFVLHRVVPWHLEVSIALWTSCWTLLHPFHLGMAGDSHPQPLPHPLQAFP